uniref:Reverse transcriptase domain-containing protein n=1 Tax=Sparus aurata TaxID=8175 RepID=A0A671Z3W6_SPAAU
MFHDSLKNRSLPRSLTEANISLILKKGKADNECASYRPISLLNTDLKLLSKTLALRLETVLPCIINNDQTGFITGRNSCSNMRSLLNVIQLSQSMKLDCIVISLDVEKAFDRVEWPDLFSTLQTLGLGETFLSWVKLLYDNPLSAVLTNGMIFSYFQLHWGTRQGCPLSPLLFAIAIEPLTEAIRRAPSISGISVGEKTHKISLYADDVLLFLTKPEVSIPAVLDLIGCFSQFSGYKINFSKSEAFSLGGLRHTNISPPSILPIQMDTTGFYISRYCDNSIPSPIICGKSYTFT